MNNTIKKALIYDQYLDTLGGGERYTLSFAKALSDLGFQVDIAWEYQETINQATDRFNLDFSSLKANRDAFETITKGSFWNKYQLTKSYDLVFWVSDGSLPFLFSKMNLVHFQVPFKKLGGNFFGNLTKSLFIHKFIYNSVFTKGIVEKKLPKSKGIVLYPPVDISKFASGKKENLIIAVGRFDAPLNNKRHDILIQAFAKFHEKEPDYELALLGGLLGEDSKIDHLKIMTQGLPVEFVPNPDFKTLKSYYSKAKFFWHAAGYDVNESTDPEKVEHFGMTTVEALSAGCIPIVINRGGQREILTSSDFLCENAEEMAQKTINQIEKNKLFNVDISNFSLDTFNEKIKELI